MSGKLAVYGVLFLVSSSIGGGLEVRLDNNRDDKKEPEKKPNILKDYVCLRDGELCHPSFAMNRGMYVSCANGVAWEQQCPKCGYHPLNCPTRTLWFDGEKCEWASPKLASQPCIDRFPVFETHNATEKDHALPDQDSILQSYQPGSNNLQLSPMAMPLPNSINKEQPDKNKWPNMNMVPNQQQPIYFKSPKSGGFDQDPSQNLQEVKSVSSSDEISADDDLAQKNKIMRRKSVPEEQVDSEPDFPTYLSPEDGAIGNKIVKLSEPVYALVNSPDGSGKQVLMRVFQPFVFEESARSLFPHFNTLK